LLEVGGTSKNPAEWVRYIAYVRARIRKEALKCSDELDPLMGHVDITKCSNDELPQMRQEQQKTD